jgi:uncharacterized protein (TIRG00374 family)
MRVSQRSQSETIAHWLGARWRVWLGAALSLLCLAWLILATDWPATGAVLAHADPRLLAAAIALNVLTVPLRAARWRLLFPPQRPPGWGRLMAALLIGQAVNQIAPARLGDLARATFVGSEPTVFVLGTQMIQVAVDLLMTVLLVTVLLFQTALPDWWRGSALAVAATASAAVAVVGLLFVVRAPLMAWLHRIAPRWPFPLVQRLLALIELFLGSLDALQRPAAMLSVLAWSAALWIVYGLTNYAVMVAVGAAAPLLAAYFVLVVLQLGVAVPSSPGRIGVFHYLSVQALAVFAVPRAQAVSFAIVLHLIAVVLPMLAGGVLAWRMGVRLTGDR